MWKFIVAGALALTIGGASLVYAQKGPRGARMTPEDAQAFVDARIAGVKAGLKLTPDQEKNWPAVESAVRDLAKERISKMQERRAQREARREARKDDKGPREQRDGIEMLRQRADALSARAAAFKKLADAAEPLYKSLDQDQKRRLHMLTRGLRAHAEGPRGHRGHGPHGDRDGPRGERL